MKKGINKRWFFSKDMSEFQDMYLKNNQEVSPREGMPLALWDTREMLSCHITKIFPHGRAVEFVDSSSQKFYAIQEENHLQRWLLGRKISQNEVEEIPQWEGIIFLGRETVPGLEEELIPYKGMKSTLYMGNGGSYPITIQKVSQGWISFLHNKSILGEDGQRHILEETYGEECYAKRSVYPQERNTWFSAFKDPISHRVKFSQVKFLVKLGIWEKEMSREF